jgi:hypothetical protein
MVRRNSQKTEAVLEKTHQRMSVLAFKDVRRLTRVSTGRLNFAPLTRMVCKATWKR